METLLKLSWARNTTPLRHSTFFNKAKHKEAWHHSIDATAGVLNPSNPKFPYTSLRSHTDAYLSKKNKLNQTDTDIRLAILIRAHDARHIAVAAVAHAMSAAPLRALLLADLNVMHGSYFGLKIWLQCLIAANDGNPASVTDMEARWARVLIPFAIQGPRAAEWFLAGVCGALRHDACISDMEVVPDFAILTRRAIADYFAQLEGYRLRCQWVDAYDAVLWMIELARTTPASTPSGDLSPEQILDSQIPSWRLWTYWQPDTHRIKLRSALKSEWLAVMPELTALEGPDIITGTQPTLRDGLITQFGATKALLRWRGLIVEIPGGTKAGLRAILERVGRALDALANISSGCQSVFNLFKELIVACPISSANLDVFEATCKVAYRPDKDIFKAVHEIVSITHPIGVQQLVALQHLIEACDDERSQQLQQIFLQDWLRSGIERCVKECQAAIRIRIHDGFPWTQLAFEFYTFCSVVKRSEHHWPLQYQHMRTYTRWTSADDLKVVLEMYDAAKSQRLNGNQRSTKSSDQEEETLALAHRMPRHSSATQGIGPRKHALERHIENYCINRLLDGGSIDHLSQRTVATILNFWQHTSQPQVDERKRELILLICDCIDQNSLLRYKCLAEIVTERHMQKFGTDTIEDDLISTLRLPENEQSEAIISLVKILSAGKIRARCWVDLLYMWIEEQCQSECKSGDVLTHSLNVMKVCEWLSFMGNVCEIFKGVVSTMKESQPVPAILRLAMGGWKSQVSKYAHTLTRLEEAHDRNREPVRYILTHDSQAGCLIFLLDHLKKAEGTPKEDLMQKVVGKLSIAAKNDLAIKDCLYHLACATPAALDACSNIWNATHGYLEIPGLPKTQRVVHATVPDTRSAIANTNDSRSVVGPGQSPTMVSQATVEHIDKRNITPAVLEVMTAGWLLNDDMNEQDRSAISSIAGLLPVGVEQHSDDVWTAKVIEAMAFWEGIEQEIMQEAARLKDLQNALLAKDRLGTRRLLQGLGIKSSSLLDDDISTLPAGLIDAVERIGEDKVEISFSLAAFTELQRDAQGIPVGADSLLLRYKPKNEDGSPSSFCFHFNNQTSLEAVKHTPWPCSADSKVPREMSCSTPQSAYIWQLNRIIHTRLKWADHIGGLEDLHKVVSTKMREMGHVCISCETSHNAKHAQLRRSTPCNMLACTRLWYQLPLEVRIPELRTDTFAVDAMLTAVYAAAMSGRAELLPSCPVSGLETVKAVLNSLPKLSTLKHVTNISKALRDCHIDAERLVSWACVHHRGYIASATGLCKIPTMPMGTHQFVLANASPRIEHEFVSRLPQYSPKTTVLFHGTTFDRLPAILAQGLKVYSGTSLQRTGAAYGKGIYMAEEPATSMPYAPATTSWRNSGLTNMRLLLGCEVLGIGRNVSSGVHVLTDEKSVIVRYMFFLTSHATVPIRNHLEPAMASAMSALRAGVV